MRSALHHVGIRYCRLWKINHRLRNFFACYLCEGWFIDLRTLRTRWETRAALIETIDDYSRKKERKCEEQSHWKMKLEGNCSTEDDSNGILLQPRKNSAVRLQIVPAQPKTITHLPKRPPVDLAFTDLTYKVREGRKNSEYTSISIYYRSV